jgi:hypothetical protein
MSYIYVYYEKGGITCKKSSWSISSVTLGDRLPQ